MAAAELEDEPTFRSAVGEGCRPSKIGLVLRERKLVMLIDNVHSQLGGDVAALPSIVRSFRPN
jgi:hypothetical protein